MKVTGTLQTLRVSITMNTSDRHDADIRIGGQFLALTITEARDLHALLGTFLKVNEILGNADDTL